MAASVAKAPSTTNWNKLPDACKLSPSWYERQNVRGDAFRALTFFGALSLSKAGYTGYTQSTKLPSFFLCLGTAVVSFLVALRCLTPSLNDRNVALQFRQKAGRDIETSKDLTFAAFFQKYKELLAKNILEPSDVSPLLERDVEQMDYSGFVTKHAGTDVVCKKALFKALTPSYQKRLSNSCRVVFALEPSKAKDEAENELLSSTPVDPNKEALLAKDWDSFIAKWNRYDIPRVSDPQALEALKTLFLAKAYKGQSDHQDCLYLFPQDVIRSLQDTLRRFELELLADEKLDFRAMIWNRSWNDIKPNLEKIDIDPFRQEALKEKLRQGYLSSLSYSDLKSGECQEMRTLLGITDEMIENMQGSVRADCDTLPYLGDGGFRSKHGNQLLKNNALQPQQLDKIRNELRATLPGTTSISHGLWEDLEILGIRDEILKARWEKMPLQVFWKEEKHSFVESAESILGAEGLKTKLKEIEGLSIFLILRDYSELFPKILKPEVVRSEEKTWVANTEEEIERVGDFFKEVVPYDYYTRSSNTLIGYLPLLFKHSLLSPNSPTLRKILRNFLLRHGKEILEYSGSHESYNVPASIVVWKQLQAIPQIMTSELKSSYETGRAAVAAANTKLQAQKKQSNDTHYVASEARKELETKKRAKNEELGEVRTLHKKTREQQWELSNCLSEKDQAVRKHQQKIYACHSTLQGLPLLRLSLQAQIKDLESQKVLDTAPLIQLTKDLPTLRSKLRTQEQEYEQLLAQDSERSRQQKEIENTRALLKTAQTEATPTSEAYNRIYKEIEAITDKKSRDERQLNPQPSMWVPHPVQPSSQEKERLQKEIAEYGQKLRELEIKRLEAQRAHQPFRNKCEGFESTLRKQEQTLATYTQELQATKELESARALLHRQEAEQIYMAGSLEVWNARSQVLEEMKRKEQAIDSQIEKCRSDLVALEKELPGLQAAHQTAKEQNEARKQKEKELERTIPELEASLKKLDTDVNNDPDYKEFFAEKERKLKEIDSEYQKELNGRIEALMKIATPEDKPVS